MSAELAQRAVECPGWAWLPRMAAIVKDERWVILAVSAHPTMGVKLQMARVQGTNAEILEWLGIATLPDLADPVTLGGLLFLARIAWNDGYRTPYFDHDNPGWCWNNDDGIICCVAPTEAELLVLALERAPMSVDANRVH